MMAKKGIGMPAIARVIEKKLARTERMLGVYSGCTNSRRLDAFHAKWFQMTDIGPKD